MLGRLCSAIGQSVFFEYRVNCISISYTVKERKVCDNFYKKNM